MGSMRSGKFRPIRKTVKPKAEEGKSLQSTASCVDSEQERRKAGQQQEEEGTLVNSPLETGHGSMRCAGDPALGL